MSPLERQSTTWSNQILPLELKPSPRTSLSPHEQEELANAALWKEARHLAEDTLAQSMTARGHFLRITPQELHQLIPAGSGHLNVLALRSAILEFFNHQHASGRVPDAIEEDPLNPTRIREVSLGGGGLGVHADRETSLVSAVCAYLRVTADHSILLETIRGEKLMARILNALEYVWTNLLHPNLGLILPPEATSPTAVPVVFGSSHIYANALAVAALRSLLYLPSLTEDQMKFWSKRRSDLTQAIRHFLWNEGLGKFVQYVNEGGTIKPRLASYAPTGFYPLGTALACQAGILNAEEASRAVAATLVMAQEGQPGDAMAWMSQCAALYAEAGFCLQALDLIRPLAIVAIERGEFSDDPESPLCAPCAQHPLMCAAAFLNALRVLRPVASLRNNTPEKPTGEGSTAPLTSFGYPYQRRFTFRKIQYEEKREDKRIPIEMPVVFSIKGLRHANEFHGVIVKPSQFGLGLQCTSNIPEGAILELTAHCDKIGGSKPCRLRGRVTWAGTKAGTKIHTGGVELDARSKDLKRWRAFILEKMRSFEP